MMMKISNSRTSAILRATLSFLIGFFFLYQVISREKIYSKHDLVEIKTCLKDYSLTEIKKFLKSDVYYYYVYVDKYNNTFEIPDNFVRHFDRNNFENFAKRGDSIKIEISRKSFEELNSRKFIELYGISNSERTFLKDKDSIEQHNGPGKNFAAAFFFIVGIIILAVNLSKESEKK